MNNESYLEKLLKIWTADREDEFVCMHILSPRSQRHVHQIFAF